MAVTWHNAHFQIYHDKRHRESYNEMINEENKPQASAAMAGSTLINWSKEPQMTKACTCQE
jgi:hypothetical protein